MAIGANELLFFGTLSSTVIPTIYSLYKETRYTEKHQMIIGGALSIAFAFMYWGSNIPEDLKFLVEYALMIFIPYGIASIIIGKLSRHNREGTWSLLFSWKQFGTLGIVFLIPTFTGSLPSEVIPNLDWPVIFEMAVIGLITSNLISLGVRTRRKHH
jgi:hypothetical protein